MSELQIIERALKQAAVRQRWQRAWHGLWHGLLAGAAVCLVTLGLYKCLPIPISSLPIAAIAGLGMVLLGILWGGWRRSHLIETARWVDAKQHLQERLSTAVEIASIPTPGRWRELVLADAAQYADRLNPRALLPFHLPAVSRWVLVILAVCAGLGFVPEYRSKTYLQKMRDSEIIRDAGRQLAELSRRTMVQHPPALPAVRQNLESVASLGDQLSQAKLTRSEALRDLASVTEKLRQEAKQLAQDPALKRLEQAARTASGKKSGATVDLQKKIEEMQKSLGDNTNKLNALDELKKEMDKVQEAASGMANKDSAGDSEAKDQLAKSLTALAQKSHSLGLSLPGLDEAIAALAGDKTELMLKDLKLAQTDLEKLRDMAKAMQQLQQQTEKMGKDLAEQLQKGQAQAAQGTLEKMVKLLKSGDLTQEQIKNLLDEVAKAVAPAGEYGKVADHLKNAVGQMKQGQKPEAAQSLAEAAKALETLLAEMGDLESLKAALAALGQAQMMVGNGDQWGRGGRGMARSGQGAKGSMGFGTWADEEGWLAVPEMSELWDNPPEDRGFMDPRSNTNRGDGELADNIDPTRIRGQMSPGGSMPSITLKGVSIKGTSTVEYQEAVMAAQTDAQNALSQEQIPRAYQGAVKDYFDDLKK